MATTLALAAVGLTADPSTLEFTQDVDDGASAAQATTIQNVSGGPVTITGVSTGTSEFSLDPQTGDCDTGTVLADSESCDVHVRFTPAGTGDSTDQLTVTADDGSEAVVDLTGHGTQTSATIDPATVDFGEQDITAGPSGAQDVTISNDGTEPITFTSISDGDETQFPITIDDCSAGGQLGAGSSCTISVAFDPTTTGPQSAVLTVDTEELADLTTTLEGDGTQAVFTPGSDTQSFADRDIDEGADTKTTTFTNTGTAPATVTSVDATGDTGDLTQLTGQAGDCVDGKTVIVNGTCDVRVEFDPDTVGLKSATFTVHSNADDVSVTAEGEGTQTELTPAPTTLPFGSQDVSDGPTTTQTSTVTNSGTEPVSISDVTAIGDSGQFERLTDAGSDCTTSTTLNANDTCEVRVRFDPTTTGGKSVTYTIDSNAPDVTVDATGTGTLTQLTPTPDTLPFGSQDVDDGPTGEQESVVQNSGDQQVTIDAVTLGGSNPKQFQRLTGNSSDCDPGTVLDPLEECDVRAVFDPSFKGAKSATVTIESNAPDATVTLTGTGTESVFESSDDPLDEGFVTNGQVNAVAFDSAGRTYLGGTFTQLGPRTGHGAKLTQASDDPASGFPDVNGTIRAVVADGSGGWFIGGDFTSVGGVPRARLAHIASSGAVDPNWDPGADGRVFALSRLGSDLYVGGEFAHVGGQARAFLARVATAGAGTVDSWNPGPNNQVRAIAATLAGVHVGGEFTQVAGASRNRIARLSPATGLPDEWDPDADGTVHSLAVDGTTVFAGGDFTNIGGAPRDRIAKLDDLDGDAVTGWNPGANATVSALAVSGTDLYAGGSFTTFGGQPRNRVAKVATDTGTTDATFDPNANNAVLTLAVTGAGVYLGGDFTQVGGQPRSRLARVATSDGAADAWDPSANAAVRSLAVSGTDIYAGGDFTSLGAVARNRLARLEPDGTLDVDWDPDANNTVSSLVVSGSSVYVGGAFTSVGGQPRDRIAKLSEAGGTADLAWNPGASGNVTALAVSGTDVYAGGLFLTIDGQSRNRLAKLTGANGDLDTAWAPAGASGQVNALALSGGDLFAGGAFLTIGGQSQPRIAKLDAGGTGAVDTSWAPLGASSTVSALAVSGTSLYAGGFFSAIGGVDRNFVAKLSTGGAGTVDLNWNPNANSIVRALAVASTDVYAGGDFTEVSGQPHNKLAKLPKAGTGTADAGWDPDVTGGNVLSLAVSGDRLAAGGSFTAVGGQSSQGFALLELPTLTTDPGGLDFGSRDVDDGPSGVMQSTVTNPGSETVTFTAVTLGGADASQFQLLTDQPGDCKASTSLPQNGSCNVRVQFAPTATGTKSAEVMIDGNSPGVDIGLTGVGTDTALSPAPTSLAFGDRDIDDGATAVQTSTVRNSGTEQVAFSSVTIAGTDPAHFQRLTDEPTDCTDTTILQPTQTCELRVRFDPSTVGTKSANVTIESDSPDDVTVALSGRGTQTELSRAPSTLPFGQQDVDDGPTAAQESVVTNSGSETVTLTGVDTTGEGDQFVRLTGLGSDCSSGTVLDAGETCKVRESFDPSTVGGKSATVTVTSNAADITIALSGTGTQTRLTPSPASLTFGSQDVDDGPTAVQESVVTNDGSEPVTIASVDIGGEAGQFERLSDEDGDCSASDVLTAGQTCKVRVRFDPTTVGAKSATVTIDSNAPDATVAVSGTGIQTQLSRSPASLSFGDRDIDDGPSGGDTSTITNTGTEPVDLDAITFGGANPGDFAQDTSGPNDCGPSTMLAANQSCDLRVRFDPATVGAKSATVTVESNAADVSVTLSGTGTQTELSRSPATLAFGNQNTGDGPTATQESIVTNTGTETVAFTSIDFTGNTGEFERLTDQGTDCTASTTLAANETCKVRATFDPTSTGGKSATVTIHSNAADVSVELTGTGVLTQLTRSQSTLAFGSRDIDDGATASETSTITNTGSETVNFSGVAFAGETTQFEHLTGDPDDCTESTVLAAGDHCDVRARFDPTTTGGKSATITISSDAADQVVTLTGTGTQTLLTRDQGTLSFGSRDIDDGPTATQTSTVTNAGTETVDLDAVTFGGSDPGQFDQVTDQGSDCTDATTLTAGQTCELRLRFDPTSTGAKSATVTVESNAADISVSLGGTGTQTELSSAPSTLAFASKDIDDGPTATQESTVTNTGTETVDLDAVTLAGTNPGQFELLTDQGTDCTATTVLTPTQTCKVRARFDPAARGAQSATVTVDSNAADLEVGLTGTGIQTELSASPATLPFGKQDIDDGATAAQDSTVTNTGTEDVTIASVAVTGDFGEFDRRTSDGSDCTDGDTLHPNDTCKVHVSFNPTSTGSKSATVTLDSNAADVTVALTGNGTQTLLTRDDDTLEFGPKDIDDGPTDVQESVVTNSGTETVDIDAVTLGGTNPGQFERLTDQVGDCTATTVLTPAQTCKVRARFDPSTVGGKSATVTVASNAADVSVALTGTGIQTELSSAPSTVALGSQDIDEDPTDVHESVVTNSGTETVDIDAVTLGGTNPGQFERLTDQVGDCTATTVLTPGQTCKVRAKFNPTTTGAKSATATIDSNAPDLVIGLSGTGTQTLLEADPTTLEFGNRDVDAGASGAMSSTISNVGTETVTLSAITLAGTDAAQFRKADGETGDCTSTTTLLAGESCEVRAQFDPTSTGSKSATITVTATTSSANPMPITLTGTGTQTELTRSSSGLAFGSRDIDDGPTAAQQSTITNSGTEPVSLSDVTIDGGDRAHFNRPAAVGGDCVAGSTTLQPNDSCNLRVRFDPGSAGQKHATAIVSATDGVEARVELAGRGTQVELTPDIVGLGFGSRDVDGGPSVQQFSTLVNTGSEPVTLSAVNVGGADAADFVRLSDSGADCAAGSTLQPDDACLVRIQFDPASTGDKAATATVASNAPDVNVGLSGTGTTEPLAARLVIPRFSAKARSTAHKRLKVKVRALDAPLHRVVVTVKTRAGKTVGKGRLRRTLAAGSTRTVTVKLKKRLKKGRYLALGTALDAADKKLTARRNFRLR